MTGILTSFIGRVAAVAKDTYFNLVTLLLPGNGTNGAQNNTFLDSSSNNFSITRNGNTTQGTFSPFSQTGWGAYSSSSDYINWSSTSTEFAIGSGDFTIEAWVFTADTQFMLFSTGTSSSATGGLGFGYNVDNGSQGLWLGRAGVGVDATSGAQLTYNQWNHIAVTRSGTSVRFFVNGTQVGTTQTVSSNYGTSAQYGYTLSDRSTALYYAGHVSNLRVVKGGALYTSSFTPSTTPLTSSVSSGTVSLLTFQSNRFVDNSVNNFSVAVSGSPSIQAFSPFAPTTAYDSAVNGGSAYFDGSGDYLSIPDNAAFTFGSGNFTVECWVYMTGAAQQFFISQWNTPQRSWGFLVKNSGTTLSFVYSTTGSNEFQVDGTITAQTNRWAHFAAVRNGNTLTTYMNGVQIGSASVTGVTLFDASQGIEIGRNPEATTTWNLTGYASDIRIVKGTAVYTAAFTPPTTPLTNITNTSLLLNYTNAGITDATAKNVLETVGNAQISTTQSKFGGSSMYFDGTGDNLLFPTSQNFSFGTGDFTIEAWVYVTASSSNTIIDTRSTDSLSNYDLNVNASDKLDFIYGTTRLTSSASVTKNQWVHVAVSRASGTIRLFINGTVDVNTASYSSAIDAPNALSVGGGRSTAGSGVTGYYFNGYIDDLRITKGYARYTASFTAPTSAFALQ